jgi:hypothetical protein
MNTENYNDVIVSKPWGHEYLCYSNESVAIWLLNIDQNASTSMHCHPNKNTGLIVLNGEIELSFLRNSIKLDALKKISIFRSRFHSSKAVSQGGAYLLEIETPVDKKDLVRLSDEYGRENKGYEGKNSFSPKNNNCIDIPKPNMSNTKISAHGSFLKHIQIKDTNYLQDLNNDDVIVFTNGGYITTDGKNILRPSDVIDKKSLKLISKQFSLSSNTTALIVSSN